MMDRIWNVSNLLSVSRIILVIPISILLCAGNPDYRWYSTGLIFLAVLTDLFDGLLARKLNQVTEFGKIIDPLADKIAVGVVTFILFIQGKFPLWFVLLVIIRDGLILAGGIYIRKKKRSIVQSNGAGKWAVTVISVLILVKILSYEELLPAENILLLISTLMLVISLVLYIQRYLTEVRTS